jgi:hypothetical protein
MNWFGIPQEDIQRAKLQALSLIVDGAGLKPTTLYDNVLQFTFKHCELPENSKPIIKLAEETDLNNDFIDVVEYLLSRGSAITNHWDYYWSPSVKHNFNNRFIIPFYWQNKLVGWTARYAGNPPRYSNIPRYWNSELPNGYLFNADQLSYSPNEYVILVEGPLDAIAINGVASLGSTLNNTQISWLNSAPQIKIVMPDRQLKNQNLIDIALSQGWYVSFPDWEPNIKDSADAAKKYGRIYTLQSIISSRTNSSLEIAMKRKLFQGD